MNSRTNFTLRGSAIAAHKVRSGSAAANASDKPVDFHPSGKTANVVMVPSLDDALRHVNVATQTIGVYPASRKAALRDRVASQGGQRLCGLGDANKHALGGPHDAMYPLQRFVHWMKDEDVEVRAF